MKGSSTATEAEPRYVRTETGELVEDPDVAPIIRMIFDLCATGHYKYRTLAEHLNSLRIKPKRGPKKENFGAHRR